VDSAGNAAGNKPNLTNLSISSALQLRTI